MGHVRLGRFGCFLHHHGRFLSRVFQEVLELRRGLQHEHRQLGFANSIACLVVALMGPILGAMRTEAPPKRSSSCSLRIWAPQ